MIKLLLDLLAIILENRHNKDYVYWYLKHSKKLSKFRDIHKGEDCFIIGNGPSLNKINLSLLKDHHTFGLNKIYLIFDKIEFDLSYHVAVNPLVIEQSFDEFEALNCPSFLSYAPAHKLARNLDHIKLIATDSIYPTPFSFCPDLTKPVFEGYTVTYVAMQIAFYMGFKNVFLVGIDHNFNTIGKPNEEQILTGEDQNHFDSSYFSNKPWHLPDLEASELSYNLAKFHYSREGRQIWDATIGGKLEIFPKIQYEDAIKICSKKIIKSKDNITI